MADHWIYFRTHWHMTAIVNWWYRWNTKKERSSLMFVAKERKTNTTILNWRITKSKDSWGTGQPTNHHMLCYSYKWWARKIKVRRMKIPRSGSNSVARLCGFPDFLCIKIEWNEFLPIIFLPCFHGFFCTKYKEFIVPKQRCRNKKITDGFKHFPYPMAVDTV